MMQNSMLSKSFSFRAGIHKLCNCFQLFSARLPAFEPGLGHKSPLNGLSGDSHFMNLFKTLRVPIVSGLRLYLLLSSRASLFFSAENAVPNEKKHKDGAGRNNKLIKRYRRGDNKANEKPKCCRVFRSAILPPLTVRSKQYLDAAKQHSTSTQPKLAQAPFILSRSVIHCNLFRF
jgi:hypothetical protein